MTEVEKDQEIIIARDVHKWFGNFHVLRGIDLTVQKGEDVPHRKVCKGPRIGVDYAGAWAQKPFRFWVQGSLGVSRPR